MGANYAAGLAEAVTDGLASLESGIAAHLAGNMFPALPLGYVQPIIDALLALAEGEPERLIGLPGDLSPLPVDAEVDDSNEFFPGYVVRADVLIDITRTEPFLGAYLALPTE